jgi:hypothetical protein
MDKHLWRRAFRQGALVKDHHSNTAKGVRGGSNIEIVAVLADEQHFHIPIRMGFYRNIDRDRFKHHDRQGIAYDENS